MSLPCSVDTFYKALSSGGEDFPKALVPGRGLAGKTSRDKAECMWCSVLANCALEFRASRLVTCVQPPVCPPEMLNSIL